MCWESMVLYIYFGVVALTLLIAIQIMGLVYRLKTDKLQKSAVLHAGLTDDSDDIIDLEEATGFWGLSVQEEKEIVLILADHEKKTAIMRAVSEKYGMHSEAKGLVLSLPIDSVMGI